MKKNCAASSSNKRSTPCNRTRNSKQGFEPFRIRRILPQSNSCTVGTTQQLKMSCATFKATTENPPMAPFAKGGGPKDRGIFASKRHFHKRLDGPWGSRVDDQRIP